MMPTPNPTHALKFLGGAIIAVGDTPLGGPAAHRHRLALLALLATTGRPMSRDKLVAYLWPERDTESARNLLKTAVHELRKVLGEGAIVSIGDQLTLEAKVLRCDVIEFEAAVAAGDFDRAEKLYAGPFLDGFFLKDAKEFEEWSDAQRARLEMMHVRVRERLATLPATLPGTDVVPGDPQPGDESPRSVPHARPKRRAARTVLAGVATVAAVLAIVATSTIAWKRDRGTAPAAQAVILPDSVGGTALVLDGARSFVGTATGTLVTSQSDNLTVDMMLRWDGRTANEYQMVFYNGHGGVTGWGLMVTGRENGQPDGTISVLAGGITIAATTLVLKQGTWHHLVAERRDGKVTVTLDDQSYSVGAFPVNAIADRYRSIERTNIGGDGPRDTPSGVFRGAIDRVRMRDLASNYFIDRWNFDEGRGTITIGEKGALLHVENAEWTPVSAPAPRDAFWRRMELACGQAYAGTVTESSRADSAVRGATVILHLRSCEPNAIRAALHVGTDRSRTFALIRSLRGLQLMYETHRRDGTAMSVSHSAAVARDSGAVGRQEFVAADGADRWSLEIVWRDHITYSRRGPEESLHMQFDLRRTVVSPPPPWSVRRE
jgi:hypothetical protein